jgi:hypothetical protein
MTTLEFYQKVGQRAFSDAEKDDDTPDVAIAVQKGIDNTGNLPRVLLSLFSKAQGRGQLEIVAIALCAGVHIGAASAKDIIEEEGLEKMMGVEA